jgi:hypothetical protein
MARCKSTQKTTDNSLLRRQWNIDHQTAPTHAAWKSRSEALLNGFPEAREIEAESPAGADQKLTGKNANR